MCGMFRKILRLLAAWSTGMTWFETTGFWGRREGGIRSGDVGGARVQEVGGARAGEVGGARSGEVGGARVGEVGEARPAYREIVVSFKCQLCPMVFDERQKYAQHRAMHAPKHFECKLCGRKFALRYSMLRHMHQHSGVKQVSVFENNLSYIYI